MDKVKTKVKMQVWDDILQHEFIQSISGKWSINEEECVDVYVNCNPDSSWECIAEALYRHQQVAAVEEVRSYLPPRGEPRF